MSNTTIITSFFDINREVQGDGRKVSEYLQWISKTLQLNCNLFIITEEKFIKFMKDARPEQYQHKTHYIVDKFENAPYYKYLSRMKEICNSQEYRTRIMHPDRVECKLPEYNVIQYSKFGWLLEAIKLNPFNSTYFFWMDIGISRFFENMDLTQEYPNPKSLELVISDSPDKFIIQKRHDLETFPIDDNFIWRSDNLMKGTMFGGNAKCIQKISELIEKILKEQMLDKNNVNNEQLALALLYKQSPEVFNLIDDSNLRHLELIFKLL